MRLRLRENFRAGSKILTATVPFWHVAKRSRKKARDSRFKIFMTLRQKIRIGIKMLSGGGGVATGAQTYRQITLDACLVQRRGGNLSPSLATLVPRARSDACDRTTALDLLVQHVEDGPPVGCLALRDEQGTGGGGAVDDHGRGVSELDLEHVAVPRGPFPILLRVGFALDRGEASDQGIPPWARQTRNPTSKPYDLVDGDVDEKKKRGC